MHVTFFVPYRGFKVQTLNKKSVFFNLPIYLHLPGNNTYLNGALNKIKSVK